MPNTTLPEAYASEISQLSPELQEYFKELLIARDLLDRFALYDPLDYMSHLSYIALEFMAGQFETGRPIEIGSHHDALKTTIEHSKEVFDFFRQYGGNVVYNKKQVQIEHPQTY